MASQTPLSTTLRKPLESPFPLSSPFDSNNDNNHSTNHGLSPRHMNEIQAVFRVFDPDLNGYIDLQSFEVMTRSLGIRMSRVEIRGEVEMAWEERLLHDDDDETDDGRPFLEGDTVEQRERIDLSMVVSILAKRGYGKRSTLDEIKMYFRLFDRDNKGYITLEDLIRVQAEIEGVQDDLREEMGNDLDVLIGFRSVGDATLKLMIEEFDVNGDGKIDLDEFCSVVGPILS